MVFFFFFGVTEFPWLSNRSGATNSHTIEAFHDKILTTFAIFFIFVTCYAKTPLPPVSFSSLNMLFLRYFLLANVNFFLNCRQNIVSLR